MLRYLVQALRLEAISLTRSFNLRFDTLLCLVGSFCAVVYLGYACISGFGRLNEIDINVECVLSNCIVHSTTPSDL